MNAADAVVLASRPVSFTLEVSMSRGLVFWIIMLVWLVLAIIGHLGLIGAYGALGSLVLLFILFVLLGWQVFGPPIHG